MFTTSKIEENYTKSAIIYTYNLPLEIKAIYTYAYKNKIIIINSSMKEGKSEIIKELLKLSKNSKDTFVLK
ncbi:hypothetical protein [Caloramator sp. ALD01]|uniref:hypothetical protein n=1 Tax=Caloramator sp. ALD01 TaxID=1031288 RepID=UPI000405A86C|nr:hypothetical protein [Caloramator sp. ALD01]